LDGSAASEDRAAFEAIVADGTRGSWLGTVQAFDSERGLGVVVAAGGVSFRFHSTAIADGSRQIAIGSAVSFVVAPALGGRFEADSLTPL
jgi:cold shock CspA family protein